MTDSDQPDGDPFLFDPNSTWMQAVELFEREGAAWLTPADAPQLMALRQIAKQLDTGAFQAALISQFTLVHRALREKGDPARAAKAGGKPQDDEGAILDMFKNNPGVMWRGDQ